MAQTPESRVKAQVKKFLKSIPTCWHFMPVQNGMGVVGIPDFICSIGGRLVGIECKAPGKVANTTPNQDRQLEGIMRSNGVAVVVDSVESLREKLALYGVWPPAEANVHRLVSYPVEAA